VWIGAASIKSTSSADAGVALPSLRRRRRREMMPSRKGGTSMFETWQYVLMGVLALLIVGFFVMRKKKS
jgi:LPXTG-motif cell wall-anchored protein